MESFFIQLCRSEIKPSANCLPRLKPSSLVACRHSKMDNRAVGASYCKLIEDGGCEITFRDLIAWAAEPWVTSHKLNRLEFLLELYAIQKIDNLKKIVKIEEKLVGFKTMHELEKSTSASVPYLDLAGHEERGNAEIAVLRNINNSFDSAMAFIAEKMSAVRGVPPEPPQVPEVRITGSLN